MISIIICTRNRAASLRRTIESVRALSTPPDTAWELIIVDNGSTDDTRAVVEAAAIAADFDVKYVFEGRKGLSYARNAGLGQARGEVIAFTDDDMLVEQDWLVRIAEQCALHPTMEMYFGRTRVSRPEQPRLAIREGDSPVTYRFPCTPNEPGSGNNMIFRASVLPSVGEFDTTLGAGTKLGSSEDHDFTYRVLRAGGQIRYCPEISAIHDHDRLTQEAVRSLLFTYGRGRGGFLCKYMVRRDLWAVKMCYWEVRSFVKMLFQPGNTARAAVHLAGLTTGLFVRLGMEIEGWMRGEIATKELPAYSSSTRVR